MKKTFRPLVVCLVCAALAGCAAGKASSSAQEAAAGPAAMEHETGRALVEKVFDVYKGYTRDGFSSQVSAGFVPLRSDFLSEVERAFYAGSIMDMVFFMEDVSRNGDKLAVSFRWEKRLTRNGTGELVKLDGTASFVFVLEDKTWRLYQVTGNDPLSAD
jgi:hypothetical protein